MNSHAEVVKVLTSKSLQLIVKEGGTGRWKANAERIARCRYVVVVRNHSLDRHSTEPWVARDDIPHGTAFLVGRGLSTFPDPESDRLYIAFEEYASISVPDQWDGLKNPVTYLSGRDLPFDPDRLGWQPFPRERAVPETAVRALTISEAKQGIAKTLGIDADAIEITIRA